MTDAREQLVRGAWDAYNRGDVAGTLAILAPDVVVYAPPTVANSGTFHGHEGFIGWIGHWNEAWDSFRIEITEVETVGERHVITAVRQSGVGRGSGIEVTMDAGWAFEVRDGLCPYLAIHPSVDEARSDALRREAGD